MYLCSCYNGAMKYYTTKELAKILGYNDDSYIRRLLIAGKIKGRKVGKQWLVSEEDGYIFKTQNQIQTKFKALLAFNYELRAHIEKTLDAGFSGYVGPREFISSFLMSKAYKTQNAMLILCESGYGEDATVLVRTIFEIMVNLLYILQDETDERAYRYINYDWILRRKMYRYVKSKPEVFEKMKTDGRHKDWKEIIDEVEKRAGEVDAKYGYKGNQWSDKNIHEMASSVGRQDASDTIYRLQCQFSHSLSRVANDYGKDNGSDGFEYFVGPSENWVEENLVATFDFLVHILESHRKLIKVEEDSTIKDLVDRYIKQVDMQKH